MSIWNKTDTAPQHLNRAEKRNVIATDVGWVRRWVKTDVHGNVRQQDEILVALDGLANSSNMGIPDITDMWHSVSTIVANTTAVSTYIAFNEPIKSTATLKINVANTAGGGAITGLANTSVLYSNNTLVFTWTPPSAGTYKVQAQTVANGSATAVDVKSVNTSAESANLVITGAVSNTAGTITVTEAE